MSNNNEREFSEEELMNVFGGFQLNASNEHPFSEAEIYGETQKEKLEELKKQLQEMEEPKAGRGRR